MGHRADQPGGPGGFGPGMFLAPQILEIADTDQDGRLSPGEASRAAEKFIRDADAEKKGSIDAQALGRAINKRLGPPPGFGPGDDGDGPGGPTPGFGPGTFLAPQIVEGADKNKDGRLTPEEAAKAAEKFVRESRTRTRKARSTATVCEMRSIGEWARLPAAPEGRADRWARNASS